MSTIESTEKAETGKCLCLEAKDKLDKLYQDQNALWMSIEAILNHFESQIPGQRVPDRDYDVTADAGTKAVQPIENGPSIPYDGMPYLVLKWWHNRTGAGLPGADPPTQRTPSVGESYN